MLKPVFLAQNKITNSELKCFSSNYVSFNKLTVPRLVFQTVLWLFLFNAAAVAQVYLFYTNNNNQIQITGCTGSPFEVSIPSIINNLPVTSIGDSSFQSQQNLRSVQIPNTVTKIGSNAFYNCRGLTNITIPSTVVMTGDFAFNDCQNLLAIVFLGNRPMNFVGIIGRSFPQVYYDPQTDGWNFVPFLKFPIYYLPALQTSNFGVTSGDFGFNITGMTGQSFVVEVSTNSAQSVWYPLSTNTVRYSTNKFPMLRVGLYGSDYFADPKWKNFPSRLYRVRKL
jgi:hypothetical protein